MELVESMFKYAFVFDLVIAAILFIIVTSWLRLKRRTFLRLMMTTSPQYDFIKGQLMTFLTENMQSLVVGIIASINREGDRPDDGLDQFFWKVYGRFDLVRRSRFGRIKFERALHFAIKAKLVSHPLDLMGTRWVENLISRKILSKECGGGWSICIQGSAGKGRKGLLSAKKTS